ncbi:MAG: uncharacterized protein QOE92_2432 [Chloroflexota bacterium]|jgi:putative CocE/NonD family hydrolase|nr:uncharacterized protein [Chloroflexota bacterium]
MRDGVELVSDVYRPAGDGPHPVLLTRTPYDRTFPTNAFHAIDLLAMALAGYACIVQDVRGRFESEGDFETYTHDADDGFDTIEWLVAQPWCDGRVGMFGTSYMAQTQMLAASRRPPGLTALAPFQSPGGSTGNDRYRGGALQLGLLASWGVGAIAIAEVLRRAKADPSLWLEFAAAVDDSDNLDEHMRRLPLLPWPPIDERAGGLGPQFDQTARFEFYPPVPRFAASEIEVPALLFAGWHDCFLQADLDLFTALKAGAASDEARRLTRLVVGPWSHGMSAGAVGEQAFGMRASSLLLDMKENITRLHKRWFDARLLGKDTGIDAEPTVKVFVMGENRWRGFDAWPPPSTTEEWFPLADGSLSRDAVTGAAEPSVFRLEPDDPVPTRGGGLLMGAQYIRGPVDQLRNEQRDDVLVFTSEALDAPLTVIGRVGFTAFVAAETVDTDVVVKLCDIHPDGRSLNVVDGILRLGRRNGAAAPELLTPGEVYEVEVDMWSTAHVFLPGHRLRLLVCASDFPRYDRNTGSGVLTADATEILPQVNRLYHDADHPSRLRLPVVS